MGHCACKDDFPLWEKRSRRDMLSIEIAVDVLRLASGSVSFHFDWLCLLLLFGKFLKRYSAESCASSGSWERCAPLLYESYSELLQHIQETQNRILQLSTIIRIPYFFNLLVKLHSHLIDALSERVEELAFVKDEESRALLNELSHACKTAGPTFDDWRKSMDFLH